MFWKATTLIALAALVGVRANPQDPPLKVAVLRMSEFNNPATCKASKDLVDKFKTYETQVREKATAMKADITKKEDDARALPPNSITQIDALEKLEDARAALDNYGKASNRIAGRMMAEGRAKIFKEIQLHAQSVASASGYSLVLKLDEPNLDDPSLEGVSGGIALTSVIWSDKALDITDKVLEKYNKEFKP